MNIFISDMALAPYPLEMALNGHLTKQVPHLMHLSVSILYPSVLLPGMQLTGQFFAQSPHFLQALWMISYLSSSGHAPAGHL
jgi:hypothetical protein